MATADAQRGRQAFYTLGCANCHHAEAESVREKPKLLASVLPSQELKGCLGADSDSARAPDYAFSTGQRTALAAFLRQGGESLRRHVAAESAERFVHALNCQTCHQRDAKNPAWPEILLDEGSQGLPPEIVPPLTWAGEKLKSDWLARQISGKLPYRSRPWLKARMPAFPAYAEALAHGLPAQHGFDPLEAASAASPSAPRRDARAAEIGRRLTLKEGGFNCRQCHGLGQQPAEAAFEARGVNFSYVADRLRYDYYRRWMLRPQRLEPGAKMPTLSQDGRTTPLTETLDGNAKQQFDAIWQYLQTPGDAKPRRR